MKLLGLVVLGMVACAPVPAATRHNSVGAIAPGKRDVAFSSALRVAQREGYIVAVSDRAGGLLTSAPTDTGVKRCGVTTCHTRSTLQVTIAETGEVVVRLQREFQSPYGAWYVSGREDDTRDTEREQEALLREIAAAAR